jgi:hypothetical protein
MVKESMVIVYRSHKGKAFYWKHCPSPYLSRPAARKHVVPADEGKWVHRASEATVYSESEAAHALAQVINLTGIRAHLE